jgi:hypothetical protein
MLGRYDGDLVADAGFVHPFRAQRRPELHVPVDDDVGRDDVDDKATVLALDRLSIV